MSRGIFDPRNLPPSRPYSPAVVVAGWVHVSGHVPFDRDGSVVGTTAREQTAQILRNIGYTLESAGASPEDIVSTTVYLTEISDIDQVDEVYREVFGEQTLPARTTVGIAALGHPAFRVEISAIAKLGSATDRG